MKTMFKERQVRMQLTYWVVFKI